MSETIENWMEGVTDETITIQVTAGQYAQLEKDQIYPGRPRVTHKVAVGPFYLPGLWVVTGAAQRIENPTTHWITLSKLED